VKDAIEFVGGPPLKDENYGNLDEKGFEIERKVVTKRQCRFSAFQKQRY